MCESQKPSCAVDDPMKNRRNRSCWSAVSGDGRTPSALTELTRSCLQTRGEPTELASWKPRGFGLAEGDETRVGGELVDVGLAGKVGD